MNALIEPHKYVIHNGDLYSRQRAFDQQAALEGFAQKLFLRNYLVIFFLNYYWLYCQVQVDVSRSENLYQSGARIVNEVHDAFHTAD